MSSIEERLVRDIEAVTGGVVMTDSDLREARDAVDDRLESRRQRNRRRTLAAGAAAAVLIPILGVTAFQTLGSDDQTAPPADRTSPDPLESFLVGEAPTAQGVEGLWRVDNDTRLVLFGADGSVRFEAEGQVYSHPNAVGSYEIDGDRINVTISESEQTGCASAELTLRGSLPGPGVMRLAEASDSASPCSFLTPGERWVLEHILPADNEGVNDFRPRPAEDWMPVTDPSILRGDWVAVGGGGHVLELTPEGTYAVATGSGEVVDRGRWTLSADRQLRLVSGSDSPTCADGSRLVLDRLAHSDPGASGFLRGTLAQNTCGGAWTPTAWFLLPQGDS